MKKKLLLYPVVLKQEPNDVFVRIPDIEGGFTQGDDEQDAIFMAQDAIGNLLEDMDERDYPKPSKSANIKLDKGEKLVFVPIDMSSFKKKYPKKVKTNVTLPSDLKEKAKEQHLNLSKILTQALEQRV